MAGRRAVGACVAAAIIFSSILLSNFTIFSGVQQEFRLEALSAEERSLGDQSTMMESDALLSLLDTAQGTVGSHPFECAAALAGVSALLNGVGVRLTEPGISVDAQMHVGSQGPAIDPVGGLQPFNGSSGSMLTLQASTQVAGSSPDSSVRIALNRSDILSLPVEVSSIAENCMLNFDLAQRALAALGSQLCNSTALGQLASSLGGQLLQSASDAGFSERFAYGYTSYTDCSVQFSVTEVQAPITGPMGPFTFTVSESGSL